MSGREALLLGALDTLYAAALEPGRWPEALQALTDLFGARGAALIVRPADGLEPLMFASARVSDWVWKAYAEHYWRTDLWAEAGSALPGNRFASSDELVPRRTLRAGEFFNDLLRPDEIGTGLFWKMDPQGTFSSVSIFGAPGQEDSLEGQRALAERLGPHLRRALDVTQRFRDVELRAAAAEDALEGASWGLALLDRSGRVLFMNREARRIVGSGEGLAAGPEGLRGLRQVDDAPLQRLIEGAIGVALGLRLGGGGSMAFPKRSSPRPYAVTVTPLPQREALFASLRPAAAVLVVDPDRAPEAPAEALRRVYGLTPAEAQVCQALAAGRSVQEVAEAQAVRAATVRRHLEAIFRKTGTRRQAELVGLLLRLAQAGAQGGTADG